MPEKEQDLKRFIDAIGAMAEMTLVFYRNTLTAGATVEEASHLAQAFIAATLFGNNGKKD